jgi:class 3 adenylate cyclase
MLIGIIFTSSNLHGSSYYEGLLDSLKKELPNIKNDTSRVEALTEIAFQYGMTNPDEGFDYAFKAIKLATEIDYELGIAWGYNRVAVLHDARGDFIKGIEYYKFALDHTNPIDTLFINANTYGNIATAYANLGNDGKAIEYYEKSLKYYRTLKMSGGIAFVLRSLMIHYAESNEKSKVDSIPAMFQYCLDLYKKRDAKSSISVLYFNYASSCKILGQYEKAYTFSHKSIDICKKIDFQDHLQNNKLFLADLFLSSSIYSEKKDSILILINEVIDFTSQNNNSNRLRIAYSYKSKYYEQLKNYNQSLKYLKLKESIEDSLLNSSRIINLNSNEYDLKINEIIAIEQQKALKKELVKDNEIAILKVNHEKQEIQNYALIGGLGAFALIIGVVIYQRRKSEALLLNILPAKIAKRLKGKNKKIADDFENATTVFIDLVGFTSYSKNKPASELLELLNNIFSRIDKLVELYGLEKIKTIGDGYMAAAGVPEPLDDHLEKSIAFAMAVRNEIKSLNKETGLNINVRIGLESGSVVAGVIGDKKFIYDLWGNSVNIASRMESTSIPGKIQITESFKNDLELRTNKYCYEKRDPIEIKGQGLMQTYFLEETN